ncbi:hypothetical protein C8J57DRAFT_1469634, partial [Mycena rebaudengoi]
MAGFLRKKKQDSVPAPAAPSPPVNTPTSPLYARFATTQAPFASQRVVSSPMALSGSPRREQVPKMTNGGPRGGVQQQPPQREDAKQTQYPVEPSYVQTNPSDSSNFAGASSSNGKPNAYGMSSNAQKRHSSPATRPQVLPDIPSPSPRRLSRVPLVDKPLPSIYPEDGHLDPLGSQPPQSSLPANRRISTRGFPPQTSAANQNRVNERVMAPPAQQPQFSAEASPRQPTRSLSTSSPRLSTRPLQSDQTPFVNPNAASGSSPNLARHPNEYGRQDLRHKLSDAGTASGRSPVIPEPASPPRQSAPGRWVPEDAAFAAASASYQDPDATPPLPNLKSRASVINRTPASTPPPPPPPDSKMGATISSFEVQSFHQGDSFKINTGLLPAQHISPKNAKPRRTPSALVKGKPLIFAAMENANDADSPSEKVEFDPYKAYGAYPTPPTEVVKMPPRYLTGEDKDASDVPFSSNVLDSWEQQQQQWPEERRTPQLNGNGHTNGARTPQMYGNTPLPPADMNAHRSYQPYVSGNVQPPPPPRTPPQNHAKLRERARSTSSTSLSSSSRLTVTTSASSSEARRSPTPSSPHTPRTLTKSRATTPQRKMSFGAQQQAKPTVERDPDATMPSRASTLMLDDDPFAKVEGVRMLKPAPPPQAPTDAAAPSAPIAVPDVEAPSTPRPEAGFDAAGSQHVISTTPPQKAPVHNLPPSPVTPEEYRNARSRRRGDHLEKAPPLSVAGVESALLEYLSFYDWCILSAVTKGIRSLLVQSTELREVALERYLRTVGYSRWAWNNADPLALSLLMWLTAICRTCTTTCGVSVFPSHEYARVAEAYVQSFNVPPQQRDPIHLATARNLTASTRAYTRVVLRLRAQAEREASDAAAAKAAAPPSASARVANGYTSSRSSPSRTSSRAPSPNLSHSHGHAPPLAARASVAGPAFRSPLFRVKRAPLLRVFVPSPDGDWLSDKSVLG